MQDFTEAQAAVAEDALVEASVVHPDVVATAATHPGRRADSRRSRTARSATPTCCRGVLSVMLVVMLGWISATDIESDAQESSPRDIDAR